MNDLRSEVPGLRRRIVFFSLAPVVIAVLLTALVLIRRYEASEAAASSAPSQSAPAATSTGAQQTDINQKLDGAERQVNDLNHRSAQAVNKSGVGVVFKPRVDLDGNTRLASDGKPLPIVNKHGDPLILEVLPNSPAGTAKIAAGDTVKAVNGKPTIGLSANQLANSIRGETGTRVILTIVSDGVTSNIELTRAPFGGMR